MDVCECCGVSPEDCYVNTRVVLPPEDRYHSGWVDGYTECLCDMKISRSVIPLSAADMVDVRQLAEELASGRYVELKATQDQDKRTELLSKLRRLKEGE